MKRLLHALGSQKTLVLTLVGLSFLWPFYQRAFFRVTLFYQLGDLAEPCFDLFLIAFLAGSFALAACHRQIEYYMTRHYSMVLIASLVSAVTTIYLSGLVIPSSPGAPQIVLSSIATIGYAICILIVSAAWLLTIMRIVYAKGLFHAVGIIVVSGMIGCGLSPTFITSPLSTGLIPLFGVLVSGISAWFAYEQPTNDVEQIQYQPLMQAPYIKTWLLPLASYLLFSVLHALYFARDITSEVHVLNGTLAAAASSASDYLVYFIFSLLLLAASVRSQANLRTSQEKATFWVAVMGVSIGLFSGLLFADASGGTPLETSFAISSISRCFTVLLLVVVLFLTYQNRLSALQSFGLFFLAVYAVEKVFAYILFPLLLALLNTPLPFASTTINLFLYIASSLVMFLFLVKLCQGNALALLFSTGSPDVVDTKESLIQDPRHTACTIIAGRFALTRRELDILAYLAAGYSAKRIGEALCISERTVQTHSLNIYRKLGVHNRQMVIDLVEEYAPCD